MAKKKRGSKFTPKQDKSIKALGEPSREPLPAVRIAAGGGYVMSYDAFQSITLDSIIEALDAQSKRFEAHRKSRMQRIKT